jgi:hypothetical protein
MVAFPGSASKWKLESLKHVLEYYRVEADTVIASCWLQLLVGSRVITEWPREKAWRKFGRRWRLTLSGAVYVCRRINRHLSASWLRYSLATSQKLSDYPYRYILVQKDLFLIVSFDPLILA